jgi:Ca-activated chloride channel homolog
VASVTVPSGLSSVSVVGPDGRSSTVAAPPEGGIVLYDQTDAVGVYHMRGAGGFDRPFTVNLLSKDESALAVQTQTALNHPAAPVNLAGVPLSSRVKNDLWTYVAAGALLFLVLEWLVFHRRL